MFGGSPPAYEKGVGGAGALSDGGSGKAAFGRVCEVIAAAAESGVTLEVGIRRGDRDAGALALALGATSVNEYPGETGGVSNATGC